VNNGVIQDVRPMFHLMRLAVLKAPVKQLFLLFGELMMQINGAMQ
jgi:hypothetical protein